MCSEKSWKIHENDSLMLPNPHKTYVECEYTGLCVSIVLDWHVILQSYPYYVHFSCLQSCHKILWLWHKITVNNLPKKYLFIVLSEKLTSWPRYWHFCTSPFQTKTRPLCSCGVYCNSVLGTWWTFIDYKALISSLRFNFQQKICYKCMPIVLMHSYLG